MLICFTCGSCVRLYQRFPQVCLRSGLTVFDLHHSTPSYRLINYNRYFHESILAKQEFREVNKPSDGNRQALINYEDTLFNG